MNAKRLQISLLGGLILFSVIGLVVDKITSENKPEPLTKVIVVVQPQTNIKEAINAVAKKSAHRKAIHPVAQKLETVSTMTVKENIVKYSIEMGVDPAIALSIAKVESGFNHNKISAGGATGVFQILPSTARKMGYDAYQLNDNIKSGILYYKRMQDKFGSRDLALAAYNAGPGNVSRYNGVPPFAETKRFIAKINSEYATQKAAAAPIVKKQTFKPEPVAVAAPKEQPVATPALVASEVNEM